MDERSRRKADPNRASSLNNQDLPFTLCEIKCHCSIFEFRSGIYACCIENRVSVDKDKKQIIRWLLQESRITE